MTLLLGRAREDRGAVAVFVVILASLLLMVAALSVDLGNAWARKRDVQTQVDVSALSAGHLLPRTAANENSIVDEVVEYLNRQNNQAVGQPDVTRVGLLDLNPENGEVIFTNAGQTMQVVAPRAWVAFSFAGVIGEDGANIQATATVEIQQSIPGQDVFPFALPQNCPYGSGMADTVPPGHEDPPPPPPAGTFTPGPSEIANHSIGSVLPNDAVEGTSPPVPVNIVLNNLKNNSTGGTIRFRIGDTIFVDRSFTWTKVTNATGNSRTVTVTDPTPVTNIVGTWNVWALDDAGKYSANNLPFTVTGAIPPPPPPNPPGCSSEVKGNFGQLQSPRSDESNPPEAFALNIAEGLDHTVVPFFNFTGPGVDCGKNPPISGATLDDANPPKDPNCLHIDNGNDGPKVMDGLVTGAGGKPGRLDVFNGTTRSNCGPNSTIKATTINNDKLSCFLLGTASLDDLTVSGGDYEDFEGMLDPHVIESPRFIWIPVFYTPDRDGAEYQPILKFVPAFITDERQGVPATSDNGVKWQGNSVESIQVFAFNAKALPVSEHDPSVPYDPSNPDQRTVVRLID